MKSIAINGKFYDEEQLLAALQKHFGVGDLPGNTIHIFRKCLEWYAKGAQFDWKRPEQDYNKFKETDELPEYTWHYYAEVADPNRPNAAKEAAE